ncbi:MAG TPA: hypothetical protein VJU60_13545 [Thermoleophilaceae bacterium]|nr:hypothetical protein [Thermoleophilaceae bacterium]
MTRAVIFAAVVACLLAFCSAAGATTYGFRITAARMSEVMTFQGDGGTACAQAGVCGYSGTVSYQFDHAHGISVVAVGPHSVFGLGDLFFGGLSTATVQGPGGGPPCTESVIRREDAFLVEGSLRRLRVVFHPPQSDIDFLRTYCVGPGDNDLSHAGAVPQITLPASSLHRKRLFLHVATTRQFHAGPFTGTLSFSAELRLRRARGRFYLYRFNV